MAMMFFEGRDGPPLDTHLCGVEQVRKSNEWGMKKYGGMEQEGRGARVTERGTSGNFDSSHSQCRLAHCIEAIA